MGLRDRFKRRVGRMMGGGDKPEPTPRPAPKKFKSKAVYRTGSERRIEGAEHMDLSAPDAAAPPPEPAPAAAPIESEVEIDKLAVNPDVRHQVRLVNDAEGLDVTIEVFENEWVLDAADRLGTVDLPSSCRNGGCYVCAGRLLEGTMTMSDAQYVLEPEQVDLGFRLLCCATVTSDAVIRTHQNDEVE